MNKIIDKTIKKIKNHIRGKNDIYLPEVNSHSIAETLILKEKYYSLNKENRDVKIIVSLTSFPARFEKLHLVIRSMLVQTMRPDAIILYLDDDVVVKDDDIDDLPDSLKEMRKYGLDIQKRSGRIKPHKKYYYSMKENPEDIVITIDDDIMYPSNLIEQLYKTHLQFPDCVVATRAHRIRFRADETVFPYNEWQWAYPVKNRPSMDLMATGCGGVLYPPHCMHEDLWNMDLFLELCPAADDLWLKIMQVRAGTKVVVTDQSVRKARAVVPGTQDITLNSKNVHENINDVYWKRLLTYYHLKRSDFVGGGIVIGLLTPTNVNNYGTKLQAYAAQELLEDYGSVEIINFKPDFIWKLLHKPEKIFLKKYSDLKSSVEKNLDRKLSLKRKEAIYSFDDKFIVAPSCVGGKALKKQATKYDAIVCGSDQIWHPVNLSAHIFMLEFVPNSVRRIALAPSFGIEHIPNGLKTIYQSRLKHIEYLSIREQSGVDILNKLGRTDTFWCLDPTLLLKKEKWNKIAMESSKLYKDPYIFCYFLGNNPFSRQIAKKIKQMTGAKIVNIPHFKSYVESDEGLADYDLYDATPQDFVNLIKNASYVCTDSFHGTAFSIIFEKEVFCCERHYSADIASTNSRLYSILSLLEISQRMITKDYQIEEELNAPIDYCKVKAILEDKRTEGRNYLNTAMRGERK